MLHPLVWAARQQTHRHTLAGRDKGCEKNWLGKVTRDPLGASILDRVWSGQAPPLLAQKGRVRGEGGVTTTCLLRGQTHQSPAQATGDRSSHLAVCSKRKGHLWYVLILLILPEPAQTTITSRLCRGVNLTEWRLSGLLTVPSVVRWHLLTTALPALPSPAPGLSSCMP